MEWLNTLLENKLVELLAGGLVGWVVTLILDPLVKSKESSSTNLKHTITIIYINKLVRRQDHFEQLDQHSSSNVNDHQVLMMLFFTAIGLGVAALVVYGTLVTQLVRLVICAAAFTAIILGIRIAKSGVFNLDNWLSRIVIMLGVCGIAWMTANLAEDGIVTTIVRAQQLGYHIASLADMFRVLGADSVLRIWYLALGLVLVVAVAVAALVAQLHMLLSAHATRVYIGGINDWRMSLLAFMGNRSSVPVFFGMVLCTGLAYAGAAGWLINLGGR